MKEKVLITWDQFSKDLSNFKPDLGRLTPLGGINVYGVPKGGMIVAGFLASAYNYNNVYIPDVADIILDDIEDSGATRQYYQEKFPDIPFRTLYNAKDYDAWLVFPWESDHPSGPDGDSIEGNITRILQYIGEDPKRDGLKNTPARVVRSYQELFSGYGKDPKSLFTTFENDGYDSMVLLRDIELYSMCEHHMLPFYGRAHVAYIPNHGKIVGISKLARLVDLFSKRLQVQERICEQVTNTLMEELAPKGAACVIEAVHMCMCARGVGKQNSAMITSSLKGVFRTDLAVREELVNLIRKS